MPQIKHLRQLMALLVVLTILGVPLSFEGGADAAHTPEFTMPALGAAGSGEQQVVNDGALIPTSPRSHQDAHRSQLLAEHQEADLYRRGLSTLSILPVALLPEWLQPPLRCVARTSEWPNHDAVRFSRNVPPVNPPPQSPLPSS